MGDRPRRLTRQIIFARKQRYFVMQAQYGQAERNFVIYAKNVFLVHIDVKKFAQGTEIAHGAMIGPRLNYPVKARTSEA